MTVIYKTRENRGMRLRRGALLATAAAILGAMPAFAQTAPVTPASPPTEPQDASDIIVTGIRSSLENALEQRRRADVIQDGISADDIGSTPDLNLGEALQRIPGVQINREEERRNASISVRGLPGRFTKTTVQGQGIASTTRGNNTGNPFGIFDSSIFNGANVIKSFTADIPAGGLSANVDLRINGALSRKDQIVARAELGYEDATEDANPAGFLSFSKHISDTFAVYATGAYSKQSFRRDTVRINGYTAFTQAPTTLGTVPANSVTTPARQQQLFPDIPLVGSNGLVNEVVFPDEIRQFSQSNIGYRVSGGAGAEWAPAPNLSLRVDGIFTRRDLKDANLDIYTVAPNDQTGVVTPLVQPVLVGAVDRNNSGTASNVYLVSDITASDFETAIGNRSFPSLDQAWAVYPQINWSNDDWQINLTGTYSRAIGRVDQTQFDERVRANTANNATGRVDANGDGIDDTGNGGFATIRTGAGNFGDYFLNVDIPSQLLNFGPDGQNYTLSGGNTIQATINKTITSPNGTSRAITQTFTTSANNERVKRDLKAIDFQIDRNLSFGPLTGASIGGFYSSEDASRVFAENSAIGLQLGRLNRDILKFNDAVNSGGPFFGGALPGAEIDGFFSLDLDRINAALFPFSRTLPPGVAFTLSNPQRIALFPELKDTVAISVTPEELIRLAPVNPLAGTLQRFPLRRVSGNNYESGRRTIEAFAQTKFDFRELNPDLGIRGNVGLRYINTKLNGQVQNPNFEFYTALAADRAARIAAGEVGVVPIILDRNATNFSFDTGTFDEIAPAQSKFERYLPSVNVIAEITDRVEMRAAYYHTFEAIDLAEFSPAPTLIQANVVDLDDVSAPAGPFTQVTVSSLGVKPRSSKAFDVGVSWYNRRGGVIALGFFHKQLINDISRSTNFCPVGETFSAGGFTTGVLSNVNGRCFFTDPAGVLQRVRIDVTRNNPNPININGFEFQIQQNFDFLPGPLKYTGGVFNYTRVRSSGDGGTQLFNVAEDTFNVIGYYERDWLQLRVAYNRQSAIQREGGTSFSGSSTFSAPYGQLDFSGAIRPTKNFEVRFEVFNITNTRREEYVGFEQLSQLTSYDGRTFGLSTTVKF